MVLGVVVPAASGRLVAIHQVPEAAAVPAVEVLHPQRRVGRRPLGELVRVTQDLIGSDELDSLAFEHRPTVAAGRLHRNHGRGSAFVSMLGETDGKRLGSAVVNIETSARVTRRSAAST